MSRFSIIEALWTFIAKKLEIEISNKNVIV